MIQTRLTVYLSCDTGCGQELHFTGGVNEYEHSVKRDAKAYAQKTNGWSFTPEGRWICRKCSCIGH